MTEVRADSTLYIRPDAALSAVASHHQRVYGRPLPIGPNSFDDRGTNYVGAPLDAAQVRNIEDATLWMLIDVVHLMRRMHEQWNGANLAENLFQRALRAAEDERSFYEPNRP